MRRLLCVAIALIVLSLSPVAGQERYAGLSKSGERFIYALYEDHWADRTPNLEYKVATLTLMEERLYPVTESVEAIHLCDLVRGQLRLGSQLVMCSITANRKTLVVAVRLRPYYYFLTEVNGPMIVALRKFFPDYLIPVYCGDIVRPCDYDFYKGPWRSVFNSQETGKEPVGWAYYEGKNFGAKLELNVYSDDTDPTLVIDVVPGPSSREKTVHQQAKITIKDGKPSVHTEWYYEINCQYCGPCKRIYSVLPRNRNYWIALQKYAADLPQAMQRFLTPEVLRQMAEQAKSRSISRKPADYPIHYCT